MEQKEYPEKKWEVISSTYVAQRPWHTVRKEHVRLANGREAPEFYVLEYPDWVNVIAVTENNDMVLIRQYRHGLERTDFELCAGVIEEGEVPVEAAKRELLEETGYGEGEWELLCRIAPNPSSQNNYAHCFLATGVKHIQDQNLDGAEDISVHIFSQKEVLEMIKNGDIIQALMLVPLWRYFALYHKELI